MLNVEIFNGHIRFSQPEQKLKPHFSHAKVFREENSKGINVSSMFLNQTKISRVLHAFRSYKICMSRDS